MKEKYLKIEVKHFDHKGEPDFFNCDHLTRYLKDNWEILAMVQDTTVKSRLVYNVNLIKN